MSDRRDFLKRFMPTVAAGTALAVAKTAEARSLNSDDFEYRGWRVQWAGWREPADQALAFGFWVARHADAAPQFWYSTTLGVVERARELETLDCSMQRKDWPSPMLISVEDRELVKRLSRDELLAKLRGERIVYDGIVEQRNESMRRFYASR